MATLSLLVWPDYGQVAIVDPDSLDAYPDWGGGEAEIVFTRFGVAIETVPDTHGTVHISIVDSYEPHSDDRILFAGSVEAVNGRLVVGSFTGAELTEIRVGVGLNAVRIFTRGNRGDVEDVTIEIKQFSG